MDKYIECEAAVSAIMQKERHNFPTYYFPDDEYAFNDGLVVAANALDEIPAADVVPVRHGRWIELENGDCKCSLCGCYHHAWEAYGYFCQHCGARMDGDGNG